jgi:hypothetical protein
MCQSMISIWYYCRRKNVFIIPLEDVLLLRMVNFYLIYICQIFISRLTNQELRNKYVNNWIFCFKTRIEIQYKRCPECEEGLCSECLNHHSVSKCTKSNEVISIENYHKLPQSVSKIVQHCTAPVRNVSIHDIKLVLLQKKERLYNTIRGCAITPNGKFLLSLDVAILSV